MFNASEIATIKCEIVDHFDWEPSEFGDRLRNYNHSKILLKDHNCFGILFYDVNSNKGIAYGLLMDLGDHGLIFNPCGLHIKSIAHILSKKYHCQYKLVELIDAINPGKQEGIPLEEIPDAEYPFFLAECYIEIHSYKAAVLYTPKTNRRFLKDAEYILNMDVKNYIECWHCHVINHVNRMNVFRAYDDNLKEYYNYRCCKGCPKIGSKDVQIN